MITLQQIDSAKAFIKDITPDAINAIEFELQDDAKSVIFLVELLRPFTEAEERLCEEKLPFLSTILPINPER